jgi:hypothetical protein
MTQIERLKEIYQLLLQKAYCKNDIIAVIEPKVSLRQLERDLIDLKNSYLRPTNNYWKSKKENECIIRLPSEK